MKEMNEKWTYVLNEKTFLYLSNTYFSCFGAVEGTIFGCVQAGCGEKESAAGNQQQSKTL